MKRTKRLKVLLVVLIVGSIATFALSQYERKKEEIQNSDAIIVEVNKDEVKSLSWTLDNSSFTFEKVEDVWKYKEDEHFPVNQEIIDEILTYFEAFGVSFIIENVEDYAQYGLDTPDCIIQLTTEEETYTLKVGDISKMDSEYYAEIGDGNVYLIKEDPSQFLKTELSDLIMHDDIPSFQDVTSIEFEGIDNHAIQYLETQDVTYSEEDHYFIEGDALDTSRVETYLKAITNTSVNSYMTYNVSEEELEAYGFNAPCLKITVNYMDEEEEKVFILEIGENQEDVLKAKDAKEDEEVSIDRYLRINDSMIIYELLDSDYENLIKNAYDDLRHEELFWGDQKLISAIDITLEDEVHHLSLEDEKWMYQEVEIEMEELMSSITSLSSTSFIDEKPSEKEEISFTIKLDHEKFEEVEVTLYRYDGDSCLATVNGETISLVDRSSVVELIEQVQKIVLN